MGRRPSTKIWVNAMTKKPNAMTAVEFKAWRARLQLTQADAAEALAVSKRAVEQWEAGANPIMYVVKLATRCLDEHPELYRTVWRFELRIPEPGHPGAFKPCYATFQNVKDAIWQVGKRHPTADVRGPSRLTLAEAIEEAGQELPVNSVIEVE